MNDRQIAIFISAAESGSFSAAAQKQHISPQGMIQQIDLLEHEIGFKLLNRTHRGVTLTDAGKQFYHGMLRITGDVRALVDQIRSTEEKRLRIGVFDMSKMMAQICERFSASHPDVAQEYVMVSPENWINELNQLHSGELDIFEHAEVPAVYLNGLDFVPLVRSRNICAVHTSHPLAKKKVLHPCDLKSAHIGIHDEACVPGLRDLLEKEAPGFTLIDGNKGPLSAFDICKNGGIFISSEDFCEKYRPLRTIPLECDLTWTYGLVFKKHPGPLVQSFIDNAKAQFPL